VEHAQEISSVIADVDTTAPIVITTTGLKAGHRGASPRQESMTMKNIHEVVVVWADNPYPETFLVLAQSCEEAARKGLKHAKANSERIVKSGKIAVRAVKVIGALDVP
jgi:hypothetical protein